MKADKNDGASKGLLWIKGKPYLLTMILIGILNKSTVLEGGQATDAFYPKVGFGKEKYPESKNQRVALQCFLRV